MKIALAQINPTVGDLRGNSHKIILRAFEARSRGADLVVFPELCIVGYPPLDLLENASFVREACEARAWVANNVPAGIGLILGGVAPNTSRTGKPLYNAAFLYEDGKLLAEVHKTLLPTYDVFDERRHFEPAAEQCIVEWRGRRLGLHICEDLWTKTQSDFPLYHIDPLDELAQQGAEVFINVCASPFAVGKRTQREWLIRENCRIHGIPYVFTNQVGANAQLIFDGSSSVFGPGGELCLQAPAFEEALTIWDEAAVGTVAVAPEDAISSLYSALVLGIRDYFHKTGTFTKAIIGLSGGIDSAVTCALAARALGSDRVLGITMPSVHSSAGSVLDSADLAQNLGIAFDTIPIRGPIAAVEAALAVPFSGTDTGVAEENIQARMRGLILMALSNKFGYLLLSTGNKSELAVGYATLYGDMNGGLAVLGDVLKTQVYKLADFINSLAPPGPISPSTITKPPSAELRPNQMDQDSLPPYAVLDNILHRYIEHKQDLHEIVSAADYDRDLVADILRKVDRNEYKRRQAPPGVKITPRAFGKDRRLPIVNRYRQR